jgi:tetratricopeptide (TPR) repeat protein
VDLSPSRSFSRIFYSNYFAFLGQKEEAIREAKEAVVVDPASILTNRNLAFVYQLSHEYSEYAAQARTTLQLAPSDPLAKWDLAWALALQEKRNAAVEQLKGGIGPLEKAIVLATMGESEQAVRALREAGTPTCPCSFGFAMIYALLGERDNAIRTLEKAFEERDAEMVQLNTNPAFDSLRSDPSIQAFLHRMNFPR